MDLVGTFEALYVRSAERNAKELDVDYTTQLNDIQDEYKMLKGQNAIVAHEAIAKRQAELREEVGKKAKNATAADMFNRAADLRDERFMRATTNHFKQQELKANLDASDAKKSLSIHTGIANSGDTVVVAQSMVEGLAEVDYSARLLGLGEDETKLNKIKYLGAFHTQMVDHLLKTQSPEDARDYLKKVDASVPESLRGEIEAPVMAAIQQKIAAAHARRIAAFKREADVTIEAIHLGKPASIGADLMSRLAGVDGPEAQQIAERVQNTMAARNVAHNVVTLPDHEIDVAAGALEEGFRQAGYADELSNSVMEYTRKGLGLRRRAESSGEMLMWAAQNNLVSEPAPIDPARPDPQAFSARVDDQAILAKQGISSTIMSDDEAAEHLAYIRGKTGATVAESYGTLQAMINGAGAESLFRFQAQAAKQDPAMATVFGVAAQGRNALAMDIMEGARIAQQKGGPRVSLSAEEKAAVQHKTLDNLFTDTTQAGRAPLLAAADALFMERVNGNPDADKEDLYEDVLKEITGGLVEHNGQMNIPPVPGMTQDKFEDVVESMTTADFVHYGNGRPVIDAGGEIEPFYPEDLESRWNGRENKFVSLGNGGYAIMQDGGGYVRTESGDPYIVELKKYYEDTGL